MSVWKNSFHDAFELSKAIIRNSPIALMATFLFGFWLATSFETSGAAASPLDDSMMIITRVGLALWELIAGFILFYLSTLPRVDSKLSLGQRVDSWDKEAWVSLAAESLRALASVLLWSLLFLLPGFIQYVRLSFVPYVVFFSKEYRAGEQDALKASKDLVKPILIPLFAITIGMGLLVFGLEMIPQMSESFRALPIRTVFEATAFLISLYGYSLIRILFHKRMIQSGVVR